MSERCLALSTAGEHPQLSQYRRYQAQFSALFSQRTPIIDWHHGSHAVVVSTGATRPDVLVILAESRQSAAQRVLEGKKS